MQQQYFADDISKEGTSTRIVTTCYSAAAGSNVGLVAQLYSTTSIIRVPLAKTRNLWVWISKKVRITEKSLILPFFFIITVYNADLSSILLFFLSWIEKTTTRFLF